LGTWIAGLATVAAVVVSLYLARRDSQIRLQVTATVGKVFGDPSVSHETEHLWILVTNVGRRGATLNSIGWRTGILHPKLPWIGRRYALQGADFPGSTRLPAKLGDGDSASFMIPLEDWAIRVGPDLIRKPRSLMSHLVFVQAHTSTNDTFSRRIAPSLRKSIQEHIRSQRKRP